MPNIAQNGINNAKLTLVSQVASNPTPKTIQLQMVTESRSSSPFHPWLDEFQASLFLENTEPNIIPFGHITIPRIKANAVEQITVTQLLEIANEDQFAAYNLMVMKSKTYRVAVRGRTGLKEGSFPKTTINFNKVIESPGMFIARRIILIANHRLIVNDMKVSTVSKASKSATSQSVSSPKKMAPT
jgi:hypothetical protein